jgi:hypothetical protein
MGDEDTVEIPGANEKENVVKTVEHIFGGEVRI